ncbi:MAG: hypothetical protein AB7O86_05695 [Porticoccaceae bacterium]
MTGDLNLPYEEVPGGPIPLDMNTKIAGGVVVRAATIPHPVLPGETLPGLVYDFFLADGQRLVPVLLVLSTEEMLAHAELIRKAVRSAINHTKKAKP